MKHMRLLFGPFFLAVAMGFIHAASGSPTSGTALRVENQKQTCGGHKWIIEHNPCPDKSRHPRYDGQHWDCCDHLTEEEEKRTAQHRKKVQERHDKQSEHGRCMGKALVGGAPACTVGDFKLPKLSTTNSWDCCKSLTPEEERRTSRKLDDIKKACHGYDFENENRKIIVRIFSCFKGRYARKIDPRSNGEVQDHWECCPELTEDEKEIGDDQRKKAGKEADRIDAANTKLHDEKVEIAVKRKKFCDENPGVCK